MRHRSVHYCLTTESDVAQSIGALKKKYPGVIFHIDIHPSHLTISYEGAPTDGLLEELYLLRPTYIFPSEQGLIEDALSNEFSQLKETLAVAESCTGGAIAAKITKIPGASSFFLGGVVAYSNQMKEKLLGVPPALLQKSGAVSDEVARSMALGLIELTGCSWAVSVSGVAGPSGGTKEKPVGTVYAAIAKKGGDIISGLIPIRAGGSRKENIEGSRDWLLAALWRKLVYHESSF